MFLFPNFIFIEGPHVEIVIECSFKSNIVLASQLEDGLFPRLFNVVKNSSYSSYLVAPLQMFPSPVYCKC
jgi:hypothetical protein